MSKGIKYGVLLGLFAYFWYQGYKPKESDYIIDQEPPSIPKPTEIKIDTTAFIKRDTTPYKGNWVDVQ